MKLAPALLLFLLPQAAQAYPELVRKGYGNCRTCHHSPNGGGLITEYGRELSAEELSQFSREGEARFLYGAFQPPEWLDLGGDLRGIQTYRDTPTQRVGDYFLMQADLEAAATAGGFFGKKLSAVATAGYDADDKSFISRRHYFVARPSDEVSIRAGRFMPAYGLNIAEHVAVTRRGLGFDQGDETYNAEAAWIGDDLNLFATGILGRPDDARLDREQGGALQASYFFLERFKAGANYYLGSNDTGLRHLLGGFGALGFTPSLFLLSELDLQLDETIGRTASGIAAYNRLDYELVQGLHAFATLEHLRLDFADDRTTTQACGGGIQYFPRPHLELQLQYQKQRATRAGSGDFIDFAWLILHFYL